MVDIELFIDNKEPIDVLPLLKGLDFPTRLVNILRGESSIAKNPFMKR